MSRLILTIALALLVSCSDDGSNELQPRDTGVDPVDMTEGDKQDVSMTDSSPDLSSDPDDMRASDTGESTDTGADTGPIDMRQMDMQADMQPEACSQPFTQVSNPAADPPFSGTAYITDELITESDPTSFVDLMYSGQGQRTMFDRRVAQFITVDAHLFDAQFGSNTVVEIQVNPEFSQTDAETQARRYAEVIGRLPAFLFRDVETVWIHRGMQAFGGGNNNLLIHTEQGESYAAGGELEEILVHEAAHTSMDSYHATTTRWAEARTADGVAISTYARDNPAREDVAESLGPYLAARFRADRVDETTVQTVAETIPNRMLYFDCLDLSMQILQ